MLWAASWTPQGLADCAIQGLKGVPVAGVREVVMGDGWVPRIAVRVHWGLPKRSHRVIPAVASSDFGSSGGGSDKGPAVSSEGN